MRTTRSFADRMAEAMRLSKREQSRRDPRPETQPSVKKPRMSQPETHVVHSIEEQPTQDDFSLGEMADESLSCPICFDLFENPIVTSCCQNMLCKGCVVSLATCPLCRNGTMKCTPAPRFVTGLIQKTPVVCVHCNASTTFEGYKAHFFSECEVDCPNSCGEKVIRDARESHRTTCRREAIRCPASSSGCTAFLAREEMESHQSECKYCAKHPYISRVLYLEQENARLRGLLEVNGIDTSLSPSNDFHY